MATDDGTVGMSTATTDRGHEVRDARIGLLFGLGAGLAALTALILGALYWQMNALWRARQGAQPAPLPVASALPEAPPEPRLQTSPADDLAAMRREEEETLRGVGWLDRRAGIVHIPIERAMELVARGAKR